jgi:hypothetical protein
MDKKYAQTDGASENEDVARVIRLGLDIGFRGGFRAD